MLSSADLPATTARCRDLGIAVYLTKPVAAADLWAAMVAALGAPAGKPSLTRPASTPATPPPARPLCILVAEDNPINQRLVVRLLERQGHAVVLADNGRAALAALEQQPFDLVLMDVQMPEMDGFETTAALRQHERDTGHHLPIIAMTAHAMKGDQERCLAAGMDAYLSKPMKAGDLYAAIDQLLASNPDSNQRYQPSPLDQLAVLPTGSGDLSLHAEVIDLFLQHAPSQLTDVQKAIQHGDGPQLERAAHCLKGTFGAIGAMVAYSLAAALETLGQQGMLEEASAVLEELEGELARLHACHTGSDQV
jgi:CheY-like chemotaxis protein/HPt (histidine-containing phosphotransfer) domain-containing protein